MHRTAGLIIHARYTGPAKSLAIKGSSAGGAAGRPAGRPGGDAGLERRIVLRTTQLELPASLVRHGLGIAVLPVGVAHQAGLTAVPIIGNTADRTVALVTRAGHDSNPAVRALLDLLRPEPAG
ncbi:LysR family transcriptional regulator substrate-binding protein [Nonomuraea spiralis]|uniref:LysR family transcriptional regulator substrate-binding protein n=1 Tax=Nonomuraea spiralis TaxID=46182 RepID=UPI0037B15375